MPVCCFCTGAGGLDRHGTHCLGQSGNGSAPAGAGSKPAWTDGNSAEKRAVSPSAAAGDTAAGGTVSGITGADLCHRQHQPHRCLHPQPDPASGDSGTGTAEPFCRTHDFLYPAEPAAGGRFPAPAGTGSLCQMPYRKEYPFRLGNASRGVAVPVYCHAAGGGGDLL